MAAARLYWETERKAAQHVTERMDAEKSAQVLERAFFTTASPE
jgi:hypothetical protein